MSTTTSQPTLPADFSAKLAAGHYSVDLLTRGYGIAMERARTADRGSRGYARWVNLAYRINREINDRGFAVRLGDEFAVPVNRYYYNRIPAADAA